MLEVWIVYVAEGHYGLVQHMYIGTGRGPTDDATVATNRNDLISIVQSWPSGDDEERMAVLPNAYNHFVGLEAWLAVYLRIERWNAWLEDAQTRRLGVGHMMTFESRIHMDAHVRVSTVHFTQAMAAELPGIMASFALEARTLDVGDYRDVRNADARRVILAEVRRRIRLAVVQAMQHVNVPLEVVRGHVFGFAGLDDDSDSE